MSSPNPLVFAPYLIVFLFLLHVAKTFLNISTELTLIQIQITVK